MDLNALNIGDRVDFTESESYSGSMVKVVAINGDQIGLEVDVDGTIDDDGDDKPQIIYINREHITNILSAVPVTWEFRVYDDMGAYARHMVSETESGFATMKDALDAARDVVGDKDRIVKVQSDDLEEIETYHATRAGWDVIS